MFCPNPTVLSTACCLALKEHMPSSLGSHALIPVVKLHCEKAQGEDTCVFGMSML